MNTEEAIFTPTQPDRASCGSSARQKTPSTPILSNITALKTNTDEQSTSSRKKKRSDIHNAVIEIMEKRRSAELTNDEQQTGAAARSSENLNDEGDQNESSEPDFRVDDIVW
jgi:hypothetical protein